MKYRILFCFLLFFLSFSFTVSVRASEETEWYTDELDYDEIQKAIDQTLQGKEKFQFQDYVEALILGENSISEKGILNDIKEGIFGNLSEYKELFLEFLVIAVVAAVLNSFAGMFQSNQVAETGFYIAYLLLFTLITGSFYRASTLAIHTTKDVLNFMSALVPTFFLSVAFASGSATSLLFYEASLILITLVDVVIVKIIIPLINVYLFIMMANNISKENILTKLSELLQTIIQWTLKTMLAAVIGFHTIRGLVIPAAEQLKRSAFYKITSFLPGIGGGLSSVTDTMFSAGALVKNAIGTAGLVVIIIICGLPLVKLFGTFFVYKLGAAAIEPVSDNRILQCMNSAAEAARLLFYTVIVSATLFMLTIALVAASTNRGI